MLMAGPSLATRFDPRNNALWVMRLALATIVAVVHAQQLGWQSQPTIGRTLLGDLAVDGFFVISGFLVTRSALRLGSLRRFAWHRGLRIMPGFWVCLLVTAFLTAPTVAALRGRSAGSVFAGEESAQSFVTANATLLIRQWEIAGIPGPLRADAMNGSLWTLFYEAVCYLGVGVLFAVGLLGPGRRRLGTLLPDVMRRHAVLLVTGLAWLAHTVWAAGLAGGSSASAEFLPRFGLLFLLGALGHLYARQVRFPVTGVVIAVAVLAVSLAFFDAYRPLGAIPFAYLVLWLMVALPTRGEAAIDASYGMYVYHWPLTLILAEAGATVVGSVAFTALALTVTAAAAVASWYLVEAPALRRKHAAWVEQTPRFLHRVGSGRAGS